MKSQWVNLYTKKSMNRWIVDTIINSSFFSLSYLFLISESFSTSSMNDELFFALACVYFNYVSKCNMFYGFWRKKNSFSSLLVCSAVSLLLNFKDVRYWKFTLHAIFPRGFAAKTNERRVYCPAVRQLSVYYRYSTIFTPRQDMTAFLYENK